MGFTWLEYTWIIGLVPVGYGMVEPVTLKLKFLYVFVKCQLDTDHHKNYETVNVTIDYKMFSTGVDLEDTVRLCFGHDLRRALEARPLSNAYIFHHHLPSSTLFKYHYSMGTAILDSICSDGGSHSRPCWLSSQPIHQRSRRGAPNMAEPSVSSVQWVSCSKTIGKWLHDLHEWGRFEQV